MHSPPQKRWLAGIVTVTVFAVLLVFCGLPRSGSVETPILPDLVKRHVSADWPMFGGSPARNMVSTTARNLPVKWVDDDGDPIKANILWTADLGSRAFGGPMIARGKVFIGTNNQNPRNKNDVKFDPLTNHTHPIDLGVLMVFNQADGKVLYQTTFPKLASGQFNDWPLEGLCSTPTAEWNRIYYTNNRCEVVCADIKDGAIIWKLDMMKDLGVFPHNMTPGSPLIVGNDLYVVTANGVDEGHINIPAPKAPSFLKLDKITGKVLWQDNSPTINYPLPKANRAEQETFFKTLVNRAEIVQHGQWSHPSFAVVGGEPQIIFPGGDGWLRAYTPGGKLIWKFDCNPKDSKYELGGWLATRSDFVMAMPVIYKDRVYIGLGQEPEHGPGVGHLWCIDMTKKGDVSPEIVVNAAVWPPVTKANPNSAKVWHHGGFIEGAKGKRKFHIGRTMSTCAIHDDLLYAADFGGYLYCLNAGTGELYWEHDTRSQTWSSPFWADGKVYLGVDNGDVWVFAHGKEKKLLARNEMGMAVRSPPVAVGEVLYIVCGNKLLALKK